MNRPQTLLFLLALLPGLGLAACEWPTASPAEACSAVSIPEATIHVDGDPADWANLQPRLVRGTGAPATLSAYRLQRVFAALDSSKIYLRIDASKGSTRPADSGPALDAGVTSCGDGKCDLGEDFNNCPQDCESNMQPEFRVTLKTTEGRMCVLSVTPCSRSGNAWCFHGNWQTDEYSSESSVNGDAKVAPQPDGGVIVEIWVSREGFGPLLSFYPTWGRCCDNDTGPAIDDEIGCAWADINAGVKPDAAAVKGPEGGPG